MADESQAQPSLTEIGARFGTDKAGAHAYTNYYEAILRHLRFEEITLLEIGIGGYSDPVSGGESLRMWKEFFPLGRIIGLDIHPKSGVEESRIETFIGDAADPAFAEAVANEAGPFDVVIDDGSHRSKDVIATFGALFPHLKSGGIYVVEDTQTSYWPRDPSGWTSFGGSHFLRNRRTSMAFFKTLADHLNFAEFDIPGYEPSGTDLEIREVAFRHNLVVISKGKNSEPSTIIPPHPIPIGSWVFAHTVKRLGTLTWAVARRVARRLFRHR